MTIPSDRSFPKFHAALCGAFLALCLSSSPLAAEEEKAGESPLPPMPDFSDEAEQMSEAARKAIAKFTAMIGPMIEGLSEWVEDLPRYEAPEVLPNGDIIIRRIPNDPDAPAEDEAAPDVTDL